MKGFDSKFIDELKRKSDIVEVARKYLDLKQNGTNYWARCPFHHEKTASFCISSIKQLYHCFGCHKSGDVISLVMELDSVDFADAVKILAEKAHLKLPEIKIDDEKIKKEKKERERILSLLLDTAKFYVKNLRSDNGYKHVEYIFKRKFTSKTVAKFGMGASLNFNDLPKYLESLGYTRQEMVLSGAVGEKNGRVYDFLGGRLIIPVIDHLNNIIAFDGRRIDGVKEQKYINTKETIVFNKSKTLFNLNNVKKAKNEKGIDGIIVVEGHLDVVSLVQAGFENVVASMGTALTKDHARIIKRYTNRVYVCFDGDFAGQKATLKSLDILAGEGLEVKVVRLIDGLDPDEVITKYGAEKYKELLINSLPLIDYKLLVLKNTYDIKTIEGRRKYLSSALKVIKESASAVEQEDLLKTLRDETGITIDSLKRELYSIEDKQTEHVIQVKRINGETDEKTVVAERYVLYAYLNNKPFALETDIEGIEFSTIPHNEIKKYIMQKIELKEQMRFNDIYEITDDETEIEKMLDFDKYEEKENGFDKAKYFADCIKTIKLKALDSEINRLSEMFSKETDVEKRRLIAIEMGDFIAKKNKLH